MNENKSTRSKVEFVRSFFGRIWGHQRHFEINWPLFSPIVFKIQSEKTSKRHRKDIEKTSTFDDFSLRFLVSELRNQKTQLRNLKTQGKVIESWCLFDVFSESFGLNFEEEGGNFKAFGMINLQYEIRICQIIYIYIIKSQWQLMCGSI